MPDSRTTEAPPADVPAASPEPEGLVGRIDAFQQQHPVVGFPLGVAYKFFDDAGTQLAALISYYAFVSLFPLLLLASTVLGFVLQDQPELQQRLLDSAASQIPVVGPDLAQPQQLGGGVIGVVIGVLGALYGGMGVAQAVQNASNAAWRVPRNKRPNPFAARGRSIVLLGLIGADVLGTSILTGIVRAAALGPVTGVAVVVGTGLVHVAVFAVVFRFSTTHPLTRRQVLPGAVTAAVAWLALQNVGAAYVGRTVSDAGGTAGVFAVVLGLLGFLYLIGLALVLSIELNAVIAERLWPRTLLTPFTDNVVLTDADRQSYTDLATAQQLKGFQRVEVDFDPSPAEIHLAEKAQDHERSEDTP
jgi:YihY family inner membrane protein